MVGLLPMRVRHTVSGTRTPCWAESSGHTVVMWQVRDTVVLLSTAQRNMLTAWEWVDLWMR